MNKFSNEIMQKNIKEEEKSLQKHIPYNNNIEESKIQPKNFVSTQKISEEKSISSIANTTSKILKIDESFGSNPNTSFIINSGSINNIPPNDIKNKVPDLVQSNIKISTMNNQSPSEFQNITNVNINTKQLNSKTSNQMIPLLNPISKEQVNKSEAKPEQISKDSKNLPINFFQQSHIQLPQKKDQQQMMEKKIEQQIPEKKIQQEIPPEKIQFTLQEQILKEQLSSSHISQKHPKNVQEKKNFEIKPDHEDEIIQMKSSINNGQKHQKHGLLKFNLEKGENIDVMSKTDFQIPSNILKLNMSQILESVENTNSTENPQFEKLSEVERTKTVEANMDIIQTSNKQDFGNYFNDEMDKNSINNNFQEHNQNPTIKFDQNVLKNHSFPPNLSENQINDINSINAHLISAQPTNNHQITSSSLNNKATGLNISMITNSPKSSNINKSSSPKFQKSFQVIPDQSNKDIIKTNSSDRSMKDPQNQNKNSHLIGNVAQYDNVKITNNLNKNQNHYTMIGSKPGLDDYQTNILDNENNRSDQSNKDLSGVNISQFISSKNQKDLVSLENHSSLIIDENNSNQNAIAYSIESKIDSYEHILIIPSTMQNKMPFDRFNVNDNKIEIDKKQMGFQILQKEVISSQTQANELGISSINKNLIHTNKILDSSDSHIREYSRFNENNSELKPDVLLSKDENISDSSLKFGKENQNMKQKNPENLESDQISTKDHQNQNVNNKFALYIIFTSMHV